MKPLEKALTEGRGRDEGLLRRRREPPVFFPSDVVNADSPQTPLEFHLASASRAWEGGKGKHREEVEETHRIGKTKEEWKDEV